MSEQPLPTIEWQIRKDYFQMHPTVEIRGLFTYKEENRRALVVGYSEGPKGLIVDYDTFRKDNIISNNYVHKMINVQVEGKKADFGIRYVPEDLKNAKSNEILWRIVESGPHLAIEEDDQEVNQVILERPISDNGRAAVDRRTVRIRDLLASSQS